MTQRFDLPTIEPESQPFWDAARDHHLMIQRCGACGAAQHYPRALCATCWSDQVVWEEASGRGTLYTFSIVYMNDLPPFNDRLPYVAAAVDLPEGPRLMTNVVGADPAELRVGMPLVVDFVQLNEEITAPVFRPA
jgi:uncharacterized OB-fold protein